MRPNGSTGIEEGAEITILNLAILSIFVNHSSFSLQSLAWLCRLMIMVRMVVMRQKSSTIAIVVNVRRHLDYFAISNLTLSSYSIFSDESFILSAAKYSPMGSTSQFFRVL